MASTGSPGSPPMGTWTEVPSFADPPRRGAPGDGQPLILADAAIIVGLQQSQVPVLIEGIGASESSRGVDVGGADLTRPRPGGPLPMTASMQGLAPVGAVDLVPGLSGPCPAHRGTKPCFLGQGDGGVSTASPARSWPSSRKAL